MAAATLESKGVVTEDATTGGGSTAIAMPSGINAGDLLIIVGGNYFSNTYACSGWTKLVDHTTFTDLFVFAKIAAGGDTATITTGFGNHYITARSFRFSGHGCATVSDIVAGTVTSSVDPASLDTGSTKEWHFLAACFAQPGAAQDAPSGYTQQSKGNSGTTSLSYGWATKTATTQVEDPGAFGGSSTVPVSIVLAVPPVATVGRPPALSTAHLRAPDAAVVRAGRW